MPTESALGWAAGVMDGEGSIYLPVTVRGANRSSFKILVTNTDPRMPMKFKEMFGGSIYRGDWAQKNLGNRVYFKWVLYGRKAAAVLRLLRPHMVCKAAEVDLALAFAATITERNNGKVGLSDEVYAFRKGLSDQLRVVRDTLPDLKEAI